MKTQITDTVAIPKATLKALKGLLFSNDGGVDLSTIIEDLGGDELTAINIALTFKGLKPKFEGDTLKFAPAYRGYFKYEYVSYSLILGTIRAKKTLYQLERAENNFREISSEMVSVNPLEWVNNFKETEAEVRERALADKR